MKFSSGYVKQMSTILLGSGRQLQRGGCIESSPHWVENTKCVNPQAVLHGLHGCFMDIPVVDHSDLEEVWAG